MYEFGTECLFLDIETLTNRKLQHTNPPIIYIGRQCFNSAIIDIHFSAINTFVRHLCTQRIHWSTSQYLHAWMEQEFDFTRASARACVCNVSHSSQSTKKNANVCACGINSQFYWTKLLSFKTTTRNDNQSTLVPIMVSKKNSSN